MNPDRESLEVVAYHEAGHAVAGIILGLDYSECTIVPGTSSDGSDYRGNTDLDVYDYVYDDPSPQRVRNAVVTLLAGSEAERFFFGRPGDAGQVDEEDVREFLQYYVDHGGKSLGSIYEEESKGRGGAFKLISQHCAAIKRVALLLLNRHTLTREEVRREMEK